MSDSANEGKYPSYASELDSRLDPAMMNRKSSESLADSQDYSRKILRVTNLN